MGLLIYGFVWLMGVLVVGAVLALWLFFELFVWLVALAIVLGRWAIEGRRSRPLPRAPRVPRRIPQARWSDRR